MLEKDDFRATWEWNLFTLGVLYILSFHYTCCLAYFSFAMTKHYLFYGSVPENNRVHEYHGEEHGSRLADMELEQSLRACVLIHKHGMERANLERHGPFKPQMPPPVKILLQQSHTS